MKREKGWKKNKTQKSKCSRVQKIGGGGIVLSSVKESDIDVSSSCTDEDTEEFQNVSNQFNVDNFAIVKFTRKKDRFVLFF